jgi:hypothetical protein
MRKWVLLIVSILIMGSLAGCLGGGDEEKKDKPPELALKRGTIEPLSGWIQGDGSAASQAVPVNLNNTNIVSVAFSVSVEDSNAENAETDQGSDPDEVTITISGGNFTETQNGMTPMALKTDFRAQGGSEEITYLSQSWTVNIEATLQGGKPVYFFGFIVYVDQGVAYTIDGEYTYMVEEQT